MAAKKSIQSLPDEAESLIEDVAAKVADEMEAILDVLMPDGRPFGMKPQSIDEQLNAYIAGGFHDDVMANVTKVRMFAMQIVQMLTSFGVPPEQIATLRPYAIAEAAALEWSAKMERLLEERMKAALRPTAAESPEASGYAPDDN